MCYQNLASILLSTSLTLMMYNPSTIAYRAPGWQGQRTPHPVGGYHHHQGWSSCCPWPSGSPGALPQPPRRFPPDTSQDLPPNLTPLNKLGTSPPGRNTITTAECKDGDKEYRLGDKWTPSGGCGRLSCTSAGKTTILGCPAPEPQANCSTTAPDARHPWPFCCPRLQCP